MGNPIKVLHIIGGGEFGGAEQHILALTEGFKGNPVQVTVILFYDSLFAKKLREQGVRVMVLQPYGRFDFLLHRKLFRLIKEEKPHIVHTHGVRANFFGRLASKKAKVKNIVTTVHSFLRHDYPKQLPYMLARFMEKVTIKMNKQFIAISDAIKEELCQKGVPSHKITKIYNGINVHAYLPTESLQLAGKQFRDEWDIPEQSFLIGTTARIVPVKGLNYLLEGFALALKNESNLKLIIVGDGPEKANLIQLAHNLHIEDNIYFTGFRTDIPAALASFDLYINSSLSEGQSISLLEAMAVEKPVLVTRVGGMKEMVQEGITGFFMPVRSPEAIAEGIVNLYRNPALRDEIAQNARAFVCEQLSHEMMIKRHIELYQSLIKGT